MNKHKVLIVANADSSLLRERVQMTIDMGHEVIWYSESRNVPLAGCKIVHARKRTSIGIVDKALSISLFFSVLRKERPELLHIHWALFTPILFMRSLPPVLVSVMGSDVNLPGRFGLRRFFARLSLNRAKLITSKSSGMDEAILALGDYGSKIRRVTWGLDEKWFALSMQKAKARERLGIEQDAVVFFSPRAHTQIYRVPEIVQAFIALLEKNPSRPLTLLVAGSFNGTEPGEDVSRLVDSGPRKRHIKLVGMLGQESMQDHYAACDAVVSYASTDGMPQSLYEAMAAGCFPIFTDLPCYTELLQDGHNALLCDTNNPESLSSQLAGYLLLKETNREKTALQENIEMVRKVASKESQEKILANIYDAIVADVRSTTA